MSKIYKTSFDGLVVYEPTVHYDDRGFFFESFNGAIFEKEEIHYNWIQDNQSRSKFGVIRGLHLQRAPYEQAKLVRCLSGTIFDVAVDLRPESKTFKHVFSVELSAENKKSVLIPRGFAHGFSVLSGYAEVAYKCDNVYNKESESGLLFSDSDLNIDWKISSGLVLVSDKDRELPTLKQYISQYL